MADRSQFDEKVGGIYGEEIDLDALGPARITRASDGEPDEQGRWLADLSPVRGPVLGPFDRRSEALGAEVVWLEANWLGGRHSPSKSKEDTRTPSIMLHAMGGDL